MMDGSKDAGFAGLTTTGGMGMAANNACPFPVPTKKDGKYYYPSNIWPIEVKDASPTALASEDLSEEAVMMMNDAALASEDLSEEAVVTDDDALPPEPVTGAEPDLEPEAETAADPEAEAVDPEAEAVDPEAEGVDPEAEPADPEAEAADPEARADEPEEREIDPALASVPALIGLALLPGGMKLKSRYKGKHLKNP